MRAVVTPFFDPAVVFKKTFPKSWGGTIKDGRSWRLSQRILRFLGTSANFGQKKLAFGEQVHGTKIKVIEGKAAWPKAGFFPEVDGLITNSQAVWLAVMHADCVPIFLFDPKKEVIGILHSGWKGTVGKIGLVALEQMVRYFGSKVAEIQVFIGVSAKPCCYTKPKDSVFLQLPEWQEFVIRDKGKLKIDLPGFIERMFLEAGINPENLRVSSRCVIHDHSYFSWTRQRDLGEAKGMGVSVLGLRGN